MIDDKPYISFNPAKSEYSDYTLETYPEKIFNSLMALLLTPKGSHPYDPEYGVGLKRYILETDVGQLSELMENDVKTAIQRYIPEMYEAVQVVVKRDLHPSGVGYRYYLRLIIRNTIVKFDISKHGMVKYDGIED